MEKLKIGIMFGEHKRRAGQPQVGKWVLEVAKEQNEAEYEIIDLRDYPPAFPGRKGDEGAIVRWNQKLSEMDGFHLHRSEYNHSISAVLKNAIDSARDAWANKAAGIVSYGSLGGARAAEHLRGYLRKCRSRTCARIPRFRSSMILKT